MTTFQRLPKILQDLSEGHTIVDEHFSKISEDYLSLLRKTEDVLIRYQLIYVQFKRQT